MDGTCTLLLDLVAGELFRAPDAGTPPKDNCEWESLRRLSERHRVSAIVWDALDRRGWTGDMDLEEKIRWIAEVDSAESGYASMEKVALAIRACLREAGVEFSILKGLGAAACYPVPAHRKFTDIDIFLPDGFDEALKLLSERFGCDVARGKNHHDKLLIRGVSVEVHRNFFNLKKYRSNSLLEKELRRLYADDRRTCMFCFLVAHAGHHFVSGEISLLNVCDVGMYLMKHQSEVDFASVRRVAALVGFESFYDVMLDILGNYLGCDLPAEAFGSSRISGRKVLEAMLGSDHADRRGSVLSLSREFFARRWRHELVFARDPMALVFLRTVCFWAERKF